MGRLGAHARPVLMVEQGGRGVADLHGGTQRLSRPGGPDRPRDGSGSSLRAGSGCGGVDAVYYFAAVRSCETPCTGFGFRGWSMRLRFSPRIQEWWREHAILASSTCREDSCHRCSLALVLALRPAARRSCTPCTTHSTVAGPAASAIAHGSVRDAPDRSRAVGPREPAAGCARSGASHPDGEYGGVAERGGLGDRRAQQTRSGSSTTASWLRFLANSVQSGIADVRSRPSGARALRRRCGAGPWALRSPTHGPP